MFVRIVVKIIIYMEICKNIKVSVTCDVCGNLIEKMELELTCTKCKFRLLLILITSFPEKISENQTNFRSNAHFNLQGVW